MASDLEKASKTFPCAERKEITTIPAKGHVKGEVKIENATESTCEKGGSYDEVVYCTVCNKELSRTTVKTEAKGHKWNNGKVTTEPTYAEEGVKYDKLYEIPTSDYRPPYTYKADAASEVPDIVPVYCGVGKIDGPTFIQIVDGNTLQPVSNWEDSDYIVGCITVFCGEVRLIDNIKYKEN